MGRYPKYDYEELAGTLFDALTERPEGMVMSEIIDLLEVPSNMVASKVITTLRLDLGEGDSITVPVIREGQKHIYKLAGTLDENHKWLIKRGRYKLQTLKTDAATMRSLIRGADGRTRNGRASKMLSLSLQRMEEDVDLYLEELMASSV